MSGDNLVYWLRREFEERVLSTQMSDARIADIHRQMADLYAKRITDWAKERSESDTDSASDSG